MNIDDSDGDNEALGGYVVNMDQGENGKKKKYKRLYDSKYKIPTAKKLAEGGDPGFTIKLQSAQQEARAEA